MKIVFLQTKQGHFLRSLSKNSRTFGEDLSLLSSKLHFHSAYENLEEELFIWRSFVFNIHFRSTIKKFLNFWRKFSAVSQILIYLSEGTSLGKVWLAFSHLERKLFGQLATKSRLVCRHSILRVQAHSLRKTIILRSKRIFTISRILRESLSKSRQFFPWLWMLHF